MSSRYKYIEYNVIRINIKCHLVFKCVKIILGLERISFFIFCSKLNRSFVGISTAAD